MRNRIHRCQFISRVFFACFVMLDASSIWAESAFASATEEYNQKTYGDCMVSDSVNLLTDEVKHILDCWEGDVFYEGITPYVTVLFVPRISQEVIYLNAESQYVGSGDSINVLIRVDNGTVRRGRWLVTEKGSAVTSNLSWLDSLLSEMAMGYRIAFQVGDQGASIRLRGSAAAISDYKSRIAQYKQ